MNLKGELFSPLVMPQVGVKYQGDTANGLRHGKGKLTTKHPHYIDKEIVLYNGLFLCDAIHGQECLLYNQKGFLEYKGEVFMGRKKYGKEYHYNGELRYEGEFDLEKPHGDFCTIYDLYGKIEYQGKVTFGKYKKPVVKDEPCKFQDSPPKNYRIRSNSRGLWRSRNNNNESIHKDEPDN